MRDIVFIFLCVIGNSGCVAGDDAAHAGTSQSWFSSMPALFSCGLAAGIGLCFIILSGKRRKRPRTENRHSKPESHTWELQEIEARYFKLEAKFREASAENELLRRQLAEAEQLTHAGSRMQASAGPASMNSSEANPRKGSATLYYLQPGSDSCFRELSKVNSASEALYVLTYQEDNPSEATFSFINSRENTSLAVQNESTWILVACERSNIPTEHTSSVRTDQPGKAILKHNEWEILQKAKITYL